MASVHKPALRRRALKEEAALMRRSKSALLEDVDDLDDSLEFPRQEEDSKDSSDFDPVSDGSDDDKFWLRIFQSLTKIG